MVHRDDNVMSESGRSLANDPALVLAVVAGILESVTARPQPGVVAATPLDMLDGLDSLRLLETVALAEEHFGVQVDTGGLDALQTVGDIVRLITALAVD